MIKRLAGYLLIFCSVALAQPEPVPLRVTRILGISTTTVVDNRNAVTRQNDMHTFCATGSGTWSVKIQYSNTSSSGPWSDFPNTFSTVSDASSACTGLAYGNYSWLRFLVTGTASAVYSGVKQFYIPTEFLSSGTVLASLNGLTGSSQTFATGTTGSDFGISSATSTHTFNLPTASGSARGALSSADWTTFNSKQSALTNSAGLRGALADETGGGLAVFNTAPALDLPQFNVYSIGGTLPAAGTANRIALVTNASAADDCTTGGGSTWVLCVDTGSTWVHPGGGGAAAAISSLNGLTGATQTFSTGTTGADFGISSFGTAHTFNLPSASAANRGLLTSADWSTFNGKGDVSTGGSYSNPSWITALAWSKITDAPVAATTNGARVGSNDGVYLEPANPAIGFNAYYDSGWKFGNASPNNYASIITRDASGNLVFSVSSATGATGAAPTFNSMTFSQSTRKLSGVTPGTAAGEVVALNGSSQVDLALIPTGTSSSTVALGDHAHSGVYEPANANIQSHIASTSNPHSVTKTQVSLGNVDNYATASQAEAEAGTAADKFMTPERTSQAIAALQVFKAVGAGLTDTGGTVSVDTTVYGRKFTSASSDPGSAACTTGDYWVREDTDETWDYTDSTPTWTKRAKGTHVHAASDVTSGTLAVAQGGTGLASGTSGGVLAYTASGTLSSSGVLTANAPVIGGGAGAAPTVGTRSGNTTEYATVTGAKTTGKQVQFDASGNLEASSSDIGGGGTGGITSSHVEFPFSGAWTTSGGSANAMTTANSVYVHRVIVPATVTGTNTWHFRVHTLQAGQTFYVALYSIDGATRTATCSFPTDATGAATCSTSSPIAAGEYFYAYGATGTTAACTVAQTSITTVLPAAAKMNGYAAETISGGMPATINPANITWTTVEPPCSSFIVNY